MLLRKHDRRIIQNSQIDEIVYNLILGFLTEGNRQDAVLVVTDARTGCCAALQCETKHTTETLIRFVLVVHIRNRTNTHTDTNGRRRSNESLSESSITTNWNPDIHESSILEWKSWSDRAMHTDTLGTTSPGGPTGGPTGGSPQGGALLNVTSESVISLSSTSCRI